MLSAESTTPLAAAQAPFDAAEDDVSEVGLTDVLTWLGEQKALAMKRSRISEILVEEGLRWRKQETWFGERVDPDFAEKRGSSPNSTPPRPMAR